MDAIKQILGELGVTDLAMPSIGILDILDIVIVAYIIYSLIFWIKETRAWTLFKGILVIFLFAGAAVLLKLNTIVWVLSNTISVGIIALIVVFQPELRKALEQLGKGRFFAYLSKLDISRETDRTATKTLDEVLKAAEKMGAAKTGALIVLEQEVPLGDLERTGIPVDAVVTSQLLVNIFEHNTPLHDGAVIIRHNRVAAATCFLPLTESNDISMELGTRHRAAIGVSEVSDAQVIVVSEETGSVSLARGGTLYRNLTTDTLRGMLTTAKSSAKHKPKLWGRWRK